MKRCDLKGFKDFRIQGVKGKYDKEIQILEGLANVTGRKTTLNYIRELYIYYDSVCYLETQILLAILMNGNSSGLLLSWSFYVICMFFRI